LKHSNSLLEHNEEEAGMHSRLLIAVWFAILAAAPALQAASKKVVIGEYFTGTW
jgi:hypothetical protein